MKILEKMHVDEVSEDTVFTLKALSYSSGVHLCALTLDVELGKVKIVKYLVVEDAGRMINKIIVEGQAARRVVHGLGGALFERLEYDEDGNLLTSNFMDYAIPTALDSPNIEVVHRVTPSLVTLDGAKGVGESGNNRFLRSSNERPERCAVSAQDRDRFEHSTSSSVINIYCGKAIRLMPDDIRYSRRIILDRCGMVTFLHCH